MTDKKYRRGYTKWDDIGKLSVDEFDNLHKHVHEGHFQFLRCRHDDETGEILDIYADFDILSDPIPAPV